MKYCKNEFENIVFHSIFLEFRLTYWCVSDVWCRDNCSTDVLHPAPDMGRATAGASQIYSS